MATYRYLFADVLTGAVIAELPVSCDRFDRTINGVGSLSCTLALADLTGLDWVGANRPRRTAIYVERDNGVLVWGGMMVTSRPLNNGASATMVAETFEGYLNRRQVAANLSFKNADLFDVVRALIATLSTQPNGDVRITVDPNIKSGQMYTGTWSTREPRKLLEEISTLAALTPGFEFTIDVDRDPSGMFTHALTLAAPSMSAQFDPILCEYPSGSVSSYEFPQDGTKTVNSLTGIGQGEGSAMLMSKQVDNADLAAGYPLFEDEFVAKEENNLGRLAERTAEALRAGIGDSTVPTVTLFGDATPAFGEYPLGIRARLRVSSPYHPADRVTGAPGLDIERRVTGWSVQPAEAGRAEMVTLSLGRLV